MTNRSDITRRQLMTTAAAAAIMLDACARAVEIDAFSIGLFASAAGRLIPADVMRVYTRGHQALGEGAAEYIHDATLNDDYLRRHSSSTFAAADGRRFRLRTGIVIDPRRLGLRMGLARGFARANRQAIMDALELGNSIILPAGDIDFAGAGPIGLPARDGITIAGAGSATRLVTTDTAFLLSDMAQLEIRDLWIEQTVTSPAAIQSFHVNLRNVRLVRLKITMRDQATCHNNCISLVTDKSPVGADGVIGVKGLLIEDCWLAPGRMGIELQNHRAGDAHNRLYGYQNVVIRGCTVWEAPAFAGMGVSLSGWGRTCTISHNRFVGCHGPNVEIIGTENLEVSGNTFESAIGSPIVVSNFRIVRGLRVLDNRTTGVPPMIGFALNAVNGCEVSRNRMATRGTFVVKGTNVRIHENELTGQGTMQIIQLDNAHNVLIENNLLHSVGRTAQRQAMVIAFNGTRGCVVRNNRMQRDDSDPRHADAWFFQAAPATGSQAYGNERRTARGVVREPAR